MVAQPRSMVPGSEGGGVQSFASGRLIQVPAVPDSAVLEQEVPSVGVIDSSKVCGSKVWAAVVQAVGVNKIVYVPSLLGSKPEVVKREAVVSTGVPQTGWL